MNDQPVNLNKARKARARAAKEQQAVENRAKFGRTKAEKKTEAAHRKMLRDKIEGAKRET